MKIYSEIQMSSGFRNTLHTSLSYTRGRHGSDELIESKRERYRDRERQRETEIDRERQRVR